MSKARRLCIGVPSRFLSFLLPLLLFRRWRQSSAAPDLDRGPPEAELMGVSRFGQTFHKDVAAFEGDKAPIFFTLPTLGDVAVPVMFGLGHHQ